MLVRSALIVLTAALAACQPQTTPNNRPDSRGPGLATVDQAVRAFQGICLRTAPDFRNARGLFDQYGMIDNRDSAITYDATGSLSIRVDSIDTGRGARMRCSIVYEDPNTFIAAERIDELIEQEREFISGARVARYQTLQGGTQVGRAWAFRAGGRIGELLEVPYSGNGNLGVLILQFERN